MRHSIAFGLIVCSLGAIGHGQSVDSLLLPWWFDSRPASAQFQSRITQLQREANLLRTVTGDFAAAAFVDGTANWLNALAGSTVSIPGTTTEAHAFAWVTPRPILGGTVRIDVQRPGTPVVLYIMLRDAANVTITAGFGSTIAQVVIETDQPTLSVSAPAGVPVLNLDRFTGGRYVGETDPTDSVRDTVAILEQAYLRTGLVPMTLQTAVQAPPLAEVRDAAPEFRIQYLRTLAELAVQQSSTLSRIDATARFSGQLFPILLPGLRGLGQPTKLAIASPLERGAVITSGLQSDISSFVVSARGTVFVVRRGRLGILNLATLTTTDMPVAPGLLGGLTYDAARGLVVVVETGLGFNRIWSFDETTSQWTLGPTLPFGMTRALAWHSGDRSLYVLGQYGLTLPHALRLLRIDSSGAVGTPIPLALNTWTPGAGIDAMQMMEVGGRLQIIGSAWPMIGRLARHAFHVDPATADILAATVFID